MTKIAAVVILYNPGSNTIKNILSYSSSVDKVYAIDNSENASEAFGRGLNRIENCIYLTKNENSGIARRLNEGSEMAIRDGYEWLLTMDQDSYFDKDDLTRYFNCVLNYERAEEVAMFGVEYVKKPRSFECHGVEQEQLITSGSMLNLALFHNLGGFDEALFIDEVDLEYCYKSISRGFRIIKFNNVFLNHSLGKVGMHKSLKSLKVTPRILHSPLRVYYMVRNFLYVNRKYKNQFTENKKNRRKGVLNRIKNNLIYGENKALLIKYILRAIIDYKRNRMGRFDAQTSSVPGAHDIG